MLFAVIAFHTTVRCNGFDVDVLVITGDVMRAVNVVRAAESLGYEFHDEEAEIVVVCLEAERPYRRQEFERGDGQLPLDHPVVLSAEKGADGVWKETWFRNDLREIAEGMEKVEGKEPDAGVSTGDGAG